ncbi:MAG: anthranilate synthase component I family protein [Pirellulaceae bacterium]
MPEPLEPHVVLLTGLSVETAFRKLRHLPEVVFLDSVRPQAPLGRYSFLAADPFHKLQAGHGDAADQLAELERLLLLHATPTIPNLPPLQGGALGYFSYDLGRAFERIPPPQFDEFALPHLSIGLYDLVLAADHLTGETWLISQGFPETDPTSRKKHAVKRADDFLRLLEAPELETTVDWDAGTPAKIQTPRYPCPEYAGVTSNFDRRQYLEMIARGIEYIYAGDIFQVNLAQRLLCPAQLPASDLFLKLRTDNPAPFAGYYDFGQGQIVSSSPERFLKVAGDLVETRPIKGTRRRSGWPELDMYSADELVHSVKDRAENVMIVDLLRNDLSRFCTPESVQVTQLCGIEHYQTVQHLVSTIEGKLNPGVGLVDILQASFPGGSITGAPKIRAMEIISELEPSARGPYCGSLGYIGFDGSIDLNILIRTIIASAGWWQFPVGGGIIADSNPQREYEETWHKASGMLTAILRP